MTFKKLVIAAAVALVASQASASSIVPYAGEGTPVVGASVIATGGHVIAKFVSGSGFYDNY
ncbi:MAG: hypothetical protein KGM99_17095, partial [Burkholderiales bacterium]|nr:hypothetical protein [Burkholderiales bacterium]